MGRKTTTRGGRGRQGKATVPSRTKEAPGSNSSSSQELQTPLKPPTVESSPKTAQPPTTATTTEPHSPTVPLSPEKSTPRVSDTDKPGSSKGEPAQSEKDLQNSESDKEEAEVVGVKEGNSQSTVRNRVTRSSLRMSANKTQVEGSHKSVSGAKRKRTHSQGMTSDEPVKKFTELESRVVLSGCCVEKGYFDEKALSVFKELIEFQGWMTLFTDCDANIAAVREFYVGLKQWPDMSMGSIVHDVEVNVSVARLSELLGIPRDGFDKYNGDGWPTLFGVTSNEIVEFLFGSKVTLQSGAFKTSNLKEPIMLLLHSLCNKVIIPRAQGRGNVRIMEMVLIYLMMKKIKINLPSLMLDHIAHCHRSSHHSLPYGSYITKLLQTYSISLSGTTVPVTIFTKTILKQKGLDISSGELKFKEEEPVAVSCNPKKKKKETASTGQDLVLQRLQKQDTKLNKLLHLVEGLSNSLGGIIKCVERRLAGEQEGDDTKNAEEADNDDDSEEEAATDGDDNDE